MRILVLGGIGEAAILARGLSVLSHTVTYSLAGLGRISDLPCAVRCGGFGGPQRLAEYLHAHRCELLIDATHPYAARISQHAVQAAEKARVLLWAYRRPAWQTKAGDDWRSVADWPAARAVLVAFTRPFITLGREPVKDIPNIPEDQHWLIRCLSEEALPITPRATVVTGRGPFRGEDELALMRRFKVDVLVCKNSGGSAVAGKLLAARHMGIPVVILERPALPPAAREFASVEALLACLAG